MKFKQIFSKNNLSRKMNTLENYRNKYDFYPLCLVTGSLWIN